MRTHGFRVRRMESEADWWRVRSLLVDTLLLAGPGFNWEVRRWDGNRFHREGGPELAERFRRFGLWETDDGLLVGIAHSEGSRGDLQLNLNPAYRAQIEGEMVAWAEEHLAVSGSDGVPTLEMSVIEYDTPRQRVLAERGWVKGEWDSVVRRMYLQSQMIPAVSLAEGYRLRTTRPGDRKDCLRMAEVLCAGFDRPGFHTAEEYWNFSTLSPSFRHDLNLVAEAPDGSFAAHVGLTFDQANRYAVFEPVCTHPEHRRKGLAQQLMFEGLHRLRALGAQIVEVGTGTAEAANALYESIGFSEAHRCFTWRKTVA